MSINLVRFNYYINAQTRILSLDAKSHIAICISYYMYIFTCVFDVYLDM